ncbi:MAG TPA: hypothetical protein VGH19_03850 [Verrucomicrobiae bacterium]
MAGATLDRKLTKARASRVAFALAKPEDDAGLRRLLRENPMRGAVTLTMEREPDYFADADLPGMEKQTIIAKEGGVVVSAGSCAVRRRFVDGRASRVGYLGGLRLDERVAGRFDIVRRGYEVLREMQQADPADYYFTSIAADNARARAFLERGVRGMPRYEFIGELVTLLLPVKGMKRAGQSLAVPTVDEVVSFLNEQNADRQFAECWTVQELEALSELGLRREDFRGVRVNRKWVAMGAVWDQRSFKQTVIREYGGALALARPWVNLAARCFGTSVLPAVGSTLANAFVSPLAVDPKMPEALTELLGGLAEVARTRGIEYLTVGFAAEDPRLGMMQREYSCREYVSRIYVVRWEDLGGAVREVEPLGLDVAWL